MLNATREIEYPVSNSWSGSTSVDCHDSKEEKKKRSVFILNTVMLFKQHIG